MLDCFGTMFRYVYNNRMLFVFVFLAINFGCKYFWDTTIGNFGWTFDRSVEGHCNRTCIAEFPSYISILLAHNGCFKLVIEPRNSQHLEGKDWKRFHSQIRLLFLALVPFYSTFVLGCFGHSCLLITFNHHTWSMKFHEMGWNLFAKARAELYRSLPPSAREPELTGWNPMV